MDLGTTAHPAADTSRSHDRAKRLDAPPILQQGALRLLVARLGGDSVRPTEAQVRAFSRFAHACDPVADDLVAAMRAGDGTLLRSQVELALESGIEAVVAPDPAVEAFIARLDDVPFWLDYDQLDLASRAIARTPAQTLMALMAGSAFPASYVSPRVNDVLLAGGELIDRTAARIVETVSWTIDCAAPGGMERFGEGTKNTARVRLVHAYIRAGLDASGTWNTETHGRPLNQLHYCVTMIPTVAVALGAMAAGHWYSRRERDAILHLYRYVAHTMGVAPELQISSVEDLVRLTWLAAHLEVTPDASSADLTRATLNAIPRIHGSTGGRPGRARDWAIYHLHSDLARLSLGTDYSDAVGIPRLSPMAAVLPIVVARNFARDRLQVALPGGSERAARRGHQERVASIAEFKARVATRKHHREPAATTR